MHAHNRSLTGVRRKIYGLLYAPFANLLRPSAIFSSSAHVLIVCHWLRRTRSQAIHWTRQPAARGASRRHVGCPRDTSALGFYVAMTSFVEIHDEIARWCRRAQGVLMTARTTYIFPVVKKVPSIRHVVCWVFPRITSVYFFRSVGLFFCPCLPRSHVGRARVTFDLDNVDR